MFVVTTTRNIFAVLSRLGKLNCDIGFAGSVYIVGEGAPDCGTVAAYFSAMGFLVG